MNYDIFNGDADGITSLLQLHLENPITSKKITGVKRDTALIKKIRPKPGDNVRVLDIGLDKNFNEIKKILEKEVNVFYADHHKCKKLLSYENLSMHLKTDKNYCTSLIISELLDKKFHLWAIVGAFGDNLIEKANYESKIMNLSVEEYNQLRSLGFILNYNSYGKNLKDLLIHPASLFNLLLKFENPFEVFAKKDSIYYQIKSQYLSDIKNLSFEEVIYENSHCKVIELPNESWSRRVIGPYCNRLCNSDRERAHAVIIKNDDETYMVSIRSSSQYFKRASEIAVRFGGGGRELAAGIDNLIDKTDFVRSFSEYFSIS